MKIILFIDNSRAILIKLFFVNLLLTYTNKIWFRRMLPTIV